MSDHMTRMIGVRDGLIHALISVGQVRASITGPNDAYLPPQSHRQKRRIILARVAVLDCARDIIQSQLVQVKNAIAAIEAAK